MQKILKNSLGNFLAVLLIFLIAGAWVFSGWPRIWQDPIVPPEIQETRAATTDLVVTSCDINDVADSTCYNAIVADGGTSDTLATKTEHLNAPFQTLAATGINSATVYYDSSGVMDTGEDWWIYVKDARDGNTICSVNPAAENSTENTDSFDCLSITITQLNNGVWLYIAGNDAKGPNYNTIDYIRLYVDYTPAIISVTLDQENFAYGSVLNNTASSTLTLWGGAGITATNGDVIADFYIYGANTTGTGGGWTLAGNTTGNNYMHEFCDDTELDCANTSVNYTALTTSPQLLEASVGIGGTVAFQLNITTPTTPTDFSEQNAVVTVQASEP